MQCVLKVGRAEIAVSLPRHPARGDFVTLDGIEYPVWRVYYRTYSNARWPQVMVVVAAKPLLEHYEQN